MSKRIYKHPHNGTDPWYNETKDDVGKAIFEKVQGLHNQQSDRRERNLRSMRLYGNRDMLGMGPATYSRLTNTALPENRVKINIVSSMCDTVTARIGKMKPRVSFLTSGAEWALQQQARKLTKYIDGLFYQNDIYSLHNKMFRDGTVLDKGAIKHFIRDGKIHSERVLSTEIYVDDVDAAYGKPTMMYHIKFIHKDILKKLYPDATGFIESAEETLDSSAALSMDLKDYKLVIESWKLPTRKNSGDGRHVISLSNLTLRDEPYTKDYFPFTFFGWSENMVGFWDQSLAERLTGNQIEINKMLRIIQKSFHLGSAFKVFLEYGSKVVKEHINNDIGSIVYYNGTKPEFYVPRTVHPEYFSHLDFLIRSSYQEAGISEFTSQSKVPKGIDGGSGKAIREYNQLESERFAIMAQKYEQSFLETAKIYIDLAIDLAKKGVDLKVPVESKRFIESIPWSDIDIDGNAYMMKMFPTSNLPNTPAGKLAYVQELLEAGFVDPEYGLKLLDFPDTDQYIQQKLAPLEDILYTLNEVVYNENFLQPEPFQDLKRGVEVFSSAYLYARQHKAPDSVLSDIQRWIVLAQDMLAKSNSGFGGPSSVPQGAAPQAGVVAAAGPAAPSAAPAAQVPQVAVG